MKNKKSIVLILLVALFISIAILPKTINNLDEIWNFNFAKNVAENRLPYRDFNMIMTPLLPIICSLFLRIFGTELIVMRILAIILCTSIIFIIYKILELLKVSKHISILSIILICSMMYVYFCIDYNFATLLVVLLAIYYELKQTMKEKEIIKFKFKVDFTLGILVGLTILFKHTTGLFISVIFILYKLLLVNNKQDFKEVLKIIGARFLGLMVPVILLIGYLIGNNIWYEFLDYCIYGVKTFNNYIPYTSLISNVNAYGTISILSILVPILFIYLYYRCVVKEEKTEENRILFIFFAYSIATFIIVYPISDGIHFLIAAMPAIIAMIYIVWTKYLAVRDEISTDTNIKLTKTIIEIAIGIFIIFMLGFGIGILYKYFSNANEYQELKHFKYIESNGNDKITNFIIEAEKQGKKVYILDATAAIYMIPIDKYNKNFDLFLIGNLGGSGEQGQIDNIENEANSEDILVLIMNEQYNRNWQTPEEVRKHIITNWTKIEEVEKFDVYERK